MGLDGQRGFNHTALERRISTPRLSPYLVATDSDVKKAIALYQWNIEISGAVYESIHVFEVILRNALDEQLSNWNATQSDSSTRNLLSRDWILDPSPLLERICGKELTTARKRAGQAVSRRTGVSAAAHADALAQLTLGTWRFMLPAKNDPGKQSLWNNALHCAFPHLERPVGQLVAAVGSVYQLRNRVAHLEPLLRSNLQAEYKNMRTVINAIDPVAHTWFTSINRIQAVGRTRPDNR